MDTGIVMTRTTKIWLGVALGVASSLLLAGCSVFGYRGGTETPDYTVVDQVRALEIRDYAPRLAADTVVQAATVEKARKQGFKRLAGYIFGDNQAGEEMAMTAPVAQSSKKIEMTAPVAQTATDRGWRIRFFLPGRLTMATAPKPTSDTVTLHEVPSQTYAVSRFSGSRGEDAVNTHIAQLTQTLADSRWETTGQAIAWFYDPPWTLPFLRRNEVAVPVEQKEAET